MRFTASHPVTGLSAEYAVFDGVPFTKLQTVFGRHDWYYSDAYRTIANIAMDYIWFGRSRGDRWHTEIAEKVQRFSYETVADYPRGIYNYRRYRAGEDGPSPGGHHGHQCTGRIGVRGTALRQCAPVRPGILEHTHTAGRQAVL